MLFLYLCSIVRGYLAALWGAGHHAGLAEPSPVPGERLSEQGAAAGGRDPLPLARGAPAAARPLVVAGLASAVLAAAEFSPQPLAAAGSLSEARKAVLEACLHPAPAADCFLNILCTLGYEVVCGACVLAALGCVSH